MALDIGAIRTGYVTRLATVTGLRVYRTVAGDLAPPAAVVAPADDFLDYHREDMQHLDRALERQQQVTATRVTHNLKGAAAVLALSDAKLAKKLDDYRAAQTKAVLDNPIPGRKGKQR